MSPSGDCGDDGQLIAVAHGRIEAADKADVVFVQVKRHEGVWAPVRIDQPRREGRVALCERLHCRAYCRALEVDHARAAGERSQDRGKVMETAI